MKDTATGQANSQLSELEAIRRAERGEAVAFEYLYKSHSKHVYSVCLRMLKNPDDAEDLTQQVFLQVFRKIGTFRAVARFATWVPRVTVNMALMHLRRKQPAEVSADCLEQDTTTSEFRAEFGADDMARVLFGRRNIARLGILLEAVHPKNLREG